ncbi:UDP-glycosyltransferase 87A1-like [Bidens hawaiensis]|uniref:UDP-glycosyltransferase 87A1-like n=1 Tax=Bidens hawaiensis TaxID=980011 RepID=UPI00404B56DC
MNQVVVDPYPGRGHINPLLNLCRLLSSRLNHTTTFTVVVTEEWLGLLNPEPEQDHNIRFVTIPNVLPSELNLAFMTAVQTKMERPFMEVLDRIESSVKLIIADAVMRWPFEAANTRNIPIAAFWPMSASTYSVVHYVDLLESHHHLYADVSERGKEIIDYIPGLSSLTMADLPSSFHSRGEIFKDIMPKLFGIKANYVLISTMYELESKTIDCLRAMLHMPIYITGPNIPYPQIEPNPSPDQPIYLNWLDSKPPRTVLYVSLGSFMSVSRAEMAEIAFGLTQSGVCFLWVARGEVSYLKEICGKNGMVVEWCDQLRVLSHSSIGGFWTHCGWNSVKESFCLGVPMLTFPIALDQPLNSKMIVKDWKIVRDFMDLKSGVRIKITETAKAFARICQESVGEGGSVEQDLDAFVRDIAMN